MNKVTQPKFLVPILSPFQFISPQTIRRVTWPRLRCLLSSQNPLRLAFFPQTSQSLLLASLASTAFPSGQGRYPRFLRAHRRPSSLISSIPASVQVVNNVWYIDNAPGALQNRNHRKKTSLARLQLKIESRGTLKGALCCKKKPREKKPQNTAYTTTLL